MEASIKKQILAAGLVAVSITVLGYWLDDDPAYANIWDTVYEVVCMITFLFALFFILFWGLGSFSSRLKARR